MTGILQFLVAPAVLLAAAPAFPAALSVAQSARTVSDPQNNTLPKAVPGAVVEYSITMTNPLANPGETVTRATFADPLPAGTELLILDYGLPGSAPIEFADGALLGLMVSGLTYSYAASAPGNLTASLEFSADSGGSWTYRPLDRGEGYDSFVTTIRVKPSGNQTATSAFRLRFRVRVR
jgi:uncharacterized repeat protein (TIGR01451 family)